MKRFIPALAMLFAFCTLHAQNTKIDTLVYTYWDGINWINNSRSINTYDADCRLNAVLIQNWNIGSSSWVNSYLTNYNYLSENYVSSTLTQNWNGTTSSWVNNYRKTITYDGSFKVVSIIDEVWFYYNAWGNFIATTYKYDNNGYVDSTLLQFAAGGGPFQNTTLIINVNNSDGTIQQTTNQNWNTITSLWENSNRYIFTYNNDKTINTEIAAIWNNTTSLWTDDQQQTYTYNGTGKLLSYLTQQWQSTQWINQSLNTNIYDGNIFLTNSLTQFWDGSNWANSSQINYSNNSDGSVQTEVIQDWDTGNNTWTNNTQRTYSYSSSCLLPIRLIAFSAVRNNYNVDLKWQTSEEINASHFSVQRSLDGINFANIDNVSAKGSGTVNHYEYIDNIEKVTGDKIYYKLKVIDKDGSYTYSKIIPIALTIYSGTIKVYPNPAKDQLFVLLNIQNTTKGEVLITDVSGNTIYRQSVNKIQNNSIANFNISSLSKGMYYVLLITDTDIQRTKFLKQ